MGLNIQCKLIPFSLVQNAGTIGHLNFKANFAIADAVIAFLLKNIVDIPSFIFDLLAFNITAF